MRKLAVALTTLVVVLSGCSGDDAPDTRNPNSRFNWSEEEQKIINDDRAMGLLAMELAWSEQPVDLKIDICMMMDASANVVVDEFYYGAGEELGLSKKDIKEFFEEKC